VLFPLCALFAALLLSATTSAAAVKAPVVKSISPKNVRVGQKLTIRGSGFLPGKGKTRVFFVRVNGKGVASAKASSATRTRLVVIVPTALNDPLAGHAARFRLRILARKFGAWSKLSRSPIVSPSSASGGLGGPPAGDCDRDGTPNSTDTDDDNDLLPDTQETGDLGTDPCNADTDGDGVQDGFEWQSALDLNRTVLQGVRPPTPYPAKRPYPNPLFPDANDDYDGDGLSDAQEQALWLKFGGHQLPLNYSAGLQTTVVTPAPTADDLLQLDTGAAGGRSFDGFLDDGQRDADGDGLSNWDEANGRMTPDWWEKAYKLEKRYPPFVADYAGTDMLDADSDGDGVNDGDDDQDHDGLNNKFEVERPWNWGTTYISTSHAGTNPWARVNPFNPCKPVFAATCHNHPPFEYYGQTEDWEGIPSSDAITGYGAPGLNPGPYHP
jgi:hypothetical protein